METSLAKKAVVYIGSQELAKISSLLPSNEKRSMIVHTLMSSLGLMNPNYSETRRLQVITPKRATYKDLAVYHTRDYLDAVLDSSKSKLDAHTAREQPQVVVNAEYGLEDDCPPFPGLAEYILIVGGATLTAVSALQQDLTDISICWDGGRHHARKAHASGFCYVADCILAILNLKRGIPPSISSVQNVDIRKKPRIMYLDLDLHFSDAVADAFYSTRSLGSIVPQILTLSIHHTSPGFFPVSSRASLPEISDDDFDPCTLSLPLHHGASNATYARVWPIVEQLKTIFAPDYTVVQCGVDALAGDPCSTFNWSLGGPDVEGSLGWCIQKVLSWPGKKLLLGGGGYNSPNAARAWAYITSIALEAPLDLDTEIPDHAGFPLYAPSFTLDVPSGNMSDRNTKEYLSSVEVCFENVYIALRNKLDT